MTKIALQRSAPGAVVNVILNLLFISLWGGIGSAVATLIAQVVSAYLADFFNRRTRHIFRTKMQALSHFWAVPLLLVKSKPRETREGEISFR